MSLPIEIVQQVQSYSTSSLLWRYNAVLDLVDQLSVASPDELVSIPLWDVLAWERGGSLVLATEPTRPPIVRLTIDSRGINKVERLSERPRFDGQRYDDRFFALLTQTYEPGMSVIRDIFIHVKVRHISSHTYAPSNSRQHGLARLWLGTLPGPQVWDAPTIPELRHCTPYLARGTQFRTQYRTIQLSRTTGITFFVFDTKVYAIHAHTSVAPCAKTTYDCSARRYRLPFVWMYVPIAPGDRLVACGIYAAPWDYISLVGSTVKGNKGGGWGAQN